MSQNTQPTKQHERRSLFRPCIDLHGGLVKQIVGGTLADGKEREGELKTNFVSE
jgi:phosphoribosylformimino-5-aminoimidazole carboxamide ribotide isomerase